jgi:hypothetical protein
MENNSQTFATITYLPEQEAERFVEFLHYSEIEEAECEPDNVSDSYIVKVYEHNYEKALNLFHIFSENELETEDDENEASVGSLYESSAEKYNDNLSSAITFMVCGVAGLVVLLLNDFGVLHIFNSALPFLILTNVVLGGLFIAFIVIGIRSLNYSKKIKSDVDKENDANAKIQNWLLENVTTEDVENSFTHELPEEMWYFSRSEYLKNVIGKQFPEFNDSIVEAASDLYIENNF